MMVLGTVTGSRERLGRGVNIVSAGRLLGSVEGFFPTVQCSCVCGRLLNVMDDFGDRWKSLGCKGRMLDKMEGLWIKWKALG